MHYVVNLHIKATVISLAYTVLMSSARLAYYAEESIDKCFF